MLSGYAEMRNRMVNRAESFWWIPFVEIASATTSSSRGRTLADNQLLGFLVARLSALRADLKEALPHHGSQVASRGAEKPFETYLQIDISYSSSELSTHGRSLLRQKAAQSKFSHENARSVTSGLTRQRFLFAHAMARTLVSTWRTRSACPRAPVFA